MESIKTYTKVIDVEAEVHEEKKVEVSGNEEEALDYHRDKAKEELPKQGTELEDDNSTLELPVNRTRRLPAEPKVVKRLREPTTEELEARFKREKRLRPRRVLRRLSPRM